LTVGKRIEILIVIDIAAHLIAPPKTLEPHLENLADLFRRMEQAYDKVAAEYGFQCQGCEDNCCLTLFFHHTLLEYIYLYQGYVQLPACERGRLRKAAIKVNQEQERAQAHGETARSMCPLNRDGRCTLYRYRPMICRLHGIPNEIRRPGGSPTRGPGCGDFDRQCADHPYIPFDRTPLYMEMAQLEKTLREALNYKEKTRLSVAQMIAGFPI